MPDITGLELVKSMKNLPAVIFTTAYSEYAIDSYELGAVDYLLKPIAFPRFFQAIHKAFEKCGQNNRVELQPASLKDTLNESPADNIKQNTDFLTVKADYKIYKINFSDLLYVEGQHEYVTFYCEPKG